MAKILIVDDSVTTRIDLRKTLEEVNHDVIEAVDGEDAIKVYKQNKDVNLVICDYHMPKLNGLGAVEGIFSEAPNGQVPCLILTTESSAQLKQEGRKIGIRGWIIKPFEKKPLLDGVRMILEKEAKKAQE
ncbi:MAG: hypothetical protein CMP10_17770 [Zetaproteobacteria bacterium]|nr:hypothetical protein [Pseudobdellovibrionaceae bacterium]|tara:strand:- start:1447 stop:1836 length:390 start_codon:yes stop_codon:yes gene_type:complete